MASMEAYPRAAMERAMKVQDVLLQAMANKITWHPGRRRSVFRTIAAIALRN
jgi:hypothetical protein